MTRLIPVRASILARTLRALCLLGALGAVGATAFADNGKPPAAPIVAGGVKSGVPSSAKPLWHELTTDQQTALAPLTSEWNTLDPVRKQKWLEIGSKFRSMKPDEQQRLQERMREWTKLTPEQRRVARENFSRAKKLDSDQKSAKWEQYQQLPEEQKKQLAAESNQKKTGGQSAACLKQTKNCVADKIHAKTLAGEIAHAARYRSVGDSAGPDCTGIGTSGTTNGAHIATDR